MEGVYKSRAVVHIKDNQAGTEMSKVISGVTCISSCSQVHQHAIDIIDNVVANSTNPRIPSSRDHLLEDNSKLSYFSLFCSCLM